MENGRRTQEDDIGVLGKKEGEKNGKMRKARGVMCTKPNRTHYFPQKGKKVTNNERKRSFVMIEGEQEETEKEGSTTRHATRLKTSAADRGYYPASLQNKKKRYFKAGVYHGIVVRGRVRHWPVAEGVVTGVFVQSQAFL